MRTTSRRTVLLWILGSNLLTFGTTLLLVARSAGPDTANREKPSADLVLRQRIRELEGQLRESEQRLRRPQAAPSRTLLEEEDRAEQTVVFYEGTDRKREEGQLRDGLRHGKWTEWHPNGQKKAEGNYLDGERWGTWRLWTEEGVLDMQGVYIDGKKEGLWRMFHRRDDATVVENFYSEDRVIWSRFN